MTNYLGSAGVQQFSITIASGSTTGTATITAVGSGAFIIYGGANPSATGSTVNSTFASLTLTNSTTITATRNTGTSGTTVVVTGCIIDGDTTNLIKSIQFGTVSLTSAQTSNTATISAVTNSNAAIAYLGQTGGNPTSYQDQYVLTNISLSGTTVTATRGTGGGFANSEVVSFVVIEFQGTALNQAVQNISATGNNVSSWTSTITSVNTSNAILIYGGFLSVNASGNAGDSLQYGQLTNSTTVTIKSGATLNRNRIYNCTAVEFSAGVLNSAVQRGTTALTAANSATSTITSVTATNAGINYLGQISTTTANQNFNQNEAAVALTNGTTVTTTTNTAPPTATVTSSWEVFEFTTGGSVTVLPINNLGGWFGI